MSELTITCPHCGSSVAEDANFCPRCGTDLRPEGAEKPATAGADSSDSTLPSSPPQKSAYPTDLTTPARSANPPESEASTLRSLAGLLDPVGVSGKWGNETLTMPDRRLAERGLAESPNAEELRRVRYRMMQEPTLVSLVMPIPPSHGVYRVYWIFGLLALGLLIPFFLTPDSPTLATQPWSGAVEAHNVIAALPDGANVLLFWAVDPASAGEMKQVAYPILRHLLRRKLHLEVISLLPGGPASAQRLLAQVAANDSEQVQNDTVNDTVNATVNATVQENQLTSFHFVPGGSTALPFIGRATCSSDTCRLASDPLVTTDHHGLLDLSSCDVANCNFALAVVVTAQAEEGQQWLELAQPLNHLPVVMVSSAAADLPLRPYWSSGQLVGLVGGFDGSANYLQKRTPLLGDAEWSSRWRFLYQLRWGHIVLLVVLFLGNLVALGNVPNENEINGTNSNGANGTGANSNPAKKENSRSERSRSERRGEE